MATPSLKQPTAHANYSNNLNNDNDFLQAIANAGLTPPSKTIDDGQIHRFPSNGKRGDDAGWYVFHSDGIAAGVFGCWRLGLVRDWCSKSSATMTPVERESHRKRVEAMQAQREAETIRRHAFAAKLAKQIWNDAEPVDAEHPYLVDKNVHQHGLRHMDDKLIFQYGGSDPSLRNKRDALIVPLYNDGDLVNLQFITPDGEKRPLIGGKMKGSYSPIGKAQPGQIIYVCEGWATGATIHQHTGTAVLCAMNAGNLMDVARYAADFWQGTELIIAGDDDRLTEGNPGKTAAIKAAHELNCKVVFPLFPDAAPLELSDFNDLALWRDMQ